MTLAHYVAGARRGRIPFLNEDFCWTTWWALRRAFPRALAAVLMPDHLHLIATAGQERRLSAVLGALTRGLGERRGRLWDPVPAARPILSAEKVRRNVRYVWLNPCRPWRANADALVTDPLAWPWSTLRDVVGAVVSPWTRAEDVCDAFDWPYDPERLHDYAMRDPDLEPAPFPVAPPPSLMPSRPVEEIFTAAVAAMRDRHIALTQRTATRRVAIGLAYRQGFTFPTRLGSLLQLRRNSVSRIAARVDPTAIARAALCLHPRLYPAPWRSSLPLRASA